MKLNIFYKILSVFIALTIPLFALLYINFSEKNVQIRFAEDEFDGNKYL